MRVRVTFYATSALLYLLAYQITPAQQTPSPTSTTGGTAASAAPPKDEPAVNDYVACVFTADQLSTFRLKPPLKVLNADRAEKTLEATTTTVDALVKKGTLGEADGQKLKNSLRSKSLLGMDAKEVQTTIGTTLSQSLSDAPAGTKQIVASEIKNAANEASDASFGTPTDVACSISPLTYKETNQIFGLSIAKQYVAYQVVARNLNPDKEFQLHNVELAVDTDPCGTKEQFDAGRDRLLVRAVAIRNQSTDPRNFTVRIMEGIATIAGSAVGFASADYAQGLAVFSALIPAGKAIFPDYTVDQLNRISDLTFSSAGQTRTVVPKNGVAMFVTFIPSRPLEQAWWAEQATQTPGGGRGSVACVNAQGVHPATHKPWGVGNPKPIAYRDWGPDALLEFRRHSSVIVAGVHTTGDDALVPAIDSLDCQNGATTLDLGGDKAKGEAPPTVTCNLKGKNLEKVVSLELRNAKEALDMVVADAPVTVKQGDSTSATAVFKGDDLRGLNGTTYDVFWTDSQKLSKTTEQVIKMLPYPILSSIEPKELQLPVSTASFLTIKGTHLKSTDAELGLKPVTEIDLTSSPDGKTLIALKVDPASATNTDTEVKVPYTATTFKDKPAVKYQVTVVRDGKIVTGASDLIVTLLSAAK